MIDWSSSDYSSIDNNLFYIPDIEGGVFLSNRDDLNNHLCYQCKDTKLPELSEEEFKSKFNQKMNQIESKQETVKEVEVPIIKEIIREVIKEVPVIKEVDKPVDKLVDEPIPIYREHFLKNIPHTNILLFIILIFLVLIYIELRIRSICINTRLSSA